MAPTEPQAVVAGHICLDLIPNLDAQSGKFHEMLSPGKLLVVGPAVTSTGGAVSNTGLALHRLGAAVSLMGKIGRDLFGEGILEILRRRDPALAEGMIVSDDPSSYTVVINPPGVDRIFLHCPGANDTFGPDDVDYAKLKSVRLFHFGYPPIMRRMYRDDGAELETLLRRVRRTGVTICLDMAMVDPASEAGKTNWPTLLARSLPHVDVFLPSLDEILFMLDRARLSRMQAESGPGGVTAQASGELLAEVSSKLIEMGAAIVVLKLGERGIYLRTTGDAARLRSAGRCAPKDVAAWAGRELLAPCFEVKVAGTTGSGDCTIAGFLAALLHNLSPEDAATTAVAAGACNVEALDAISGVRPWDEMQRRIAAGWKRRPMQEKLKGWRFDKISGNYLGPNDAA